MDLIPGHFSQFTTEIGLNCKHWQCQEVFFSVLQLICSPLIPPPQREHYPALPGGEHCLSGKSLESPLINNDKIIT